MPAQLEPAPTKALDGILHGPQKSANCEVLFLDYRNPANFSDLWLKGLESSLPTINAQQCDWTDGSKQILIIGNDPPDEVFQNRAPGLKGINFRSHFTATSWLAAWKVKFPGAKTAIAVIDPREPNLASGAAHALQTILGARDASGQTLVPRATVLNAPSLDGICQWLHDSKTDHRVVPKAAPHLPDLLKATIWNELTSDREQHHALSNVLGAFLLGSQVGKGSPHPGDPWAQDFLLALVQACGVGAKTGQVRLKDHRGFQCWVNPQLQRDIGAAVLIDDMADIWEFFVRGALGFVGDVELRNTGRTFRESLIISNSSVFDQTMLGLPDRLAKVLKEDRRTLTAADLLPGSHHFDNEFVLFLDLRMFDANATQTADQFNEKLVAFGNQLLAQKTRPLPWLDDDANRFIDFERELEGDAIAGQPRETLLPRILSLLDPTLPIVIFSSTHRTELIDPFHDYGNIITTFRKPILTGMAQNWNHLVMDLHANFCAALEKAASILRVRRELARLTISKPVASPRESVSRKGGIIEIYIDESGDPFNQRDPGFAVGGIMLQHDNAEAQQMFHKQINQAPAKWGVSDYAPDRIRADEVDDKLPRISFYPKKPTPNGQQEAEALDFVACALGGKSRIAAFALIEPDLLRFSRDTRLDSAILFDRNSLDNVYHFLLRTNLETLFFEHPWIDLKADSLFIHVATRQQTVHDPNTQRIWQQAYGIEFKERKGEWQYTSLEMGSVYRLVRELLQSRASLDNQPDIVMARGVTLNDYEDIVSKWQKEGQTPRINSQLYDPTRLDPKQIHYLADWIVRMALYRQCNQIPLCVGDWFEAGYIQPLTDEFLALLDACRHASPGKSIRRLAKINLSQEDSVRKGLRAEKYLRQKASTWPEKLLSDDLRGLFRESKTRSVATRPRQTAPAASVPARIDPATQKSESSQIRWRVLIKASVGCDKSRLLTALQSNISIPQPMAIRMFVSDEKVEFILDLASAEAVLKFIKNPIEISGARVAATDVTLPQSYRIQNPVPAVQE
ncbi:MAG: hypothetical protein IH623_10240 [Verrucomicrobia bacterium]|nr:hypothetical protein [Verrucomicrobiota bacterium]